MQGLKDETDTIVAQLNSNSLAITHVFQSLTLSTPQHCLKQLEVSLFELLMTIDVRGILTMLGLRQTSGS
jgi:hypothetical protein